MKKKQTETLTTETCSNCKFWKEVDPLGDAVNECRRNAPSPQASSYQLRWPMTGASKWCGEWKPINAADRS
jgi:hypothetical protein